ncbi:winged helix-turn-helix domain-containing protein [Amycolatopsis orientalis]|uniref:winged helix-turn-helix domain-containing protein n=1 Tax=Amycolatopsis orientalis TaxID=31958 RepID=UPI000567E96E|nr:winged helix-turn-helix domain-containing protein [Amycolatopsis orientalis]
MSRGGLDRDIIVDLLKQPGMTQAEIARMYGTTRAAVSYHLRKKPGPAYPKRTADNLAERMPWPEASGKVKRTPEWRKLLNHLEYVETGGRGMSDDKLARLAGFYRELEEFNVVVEFDPSIPPRPGSAGGGWAFVPRTEKDGDLIIRVNEHTQMTPRDYTVWKMPKVRPNSER